MKKPGAGERINKLIKQYGSNGTKTAKSSSAQPVKVSAGQRINSLISQYGSGSNLQDVFKKLQDSYNSEVDTYSGYIQKLQNASNSGTEDLSERTKRALFGENYYTAPKNQDSIFGHYEQMREIQEERAANLSNLRNRFELSRKYIGDDAADKYIRALDDMIGGYDALLDMSQYDSREAYEKDLEDSKLHSQYGGMSYEEKMDALKTLDPASKEYEWLNSYFKSAPTTREDRNRWQNEQQSKITALENEYQTANDNRKKEITEELRVINAELRAYDLGENGWIRKEVDDYYTIPLNEDFAAGSANRTFAKPSRENLGLFDAMMDTSLWYWDTEGNRRDALDNIVYEAGKANTDERGIVIHPMASDERFLIQDRYGMWANATEEERIDAYAAINNEGGYNSWANAIIDGDEKEWDLLEKEEVDTYYYLLNTEGPVAASAYLDDMAITLKQRSGYKLAEKVLGIENALGRGVAKLGVGFVAGIDQYIADTKQLLNQEALPASKLQTANAQIYNESDGLGKYAYSAAVNIGNMTPSILVSSLMTVAGVPHQVSEAVGSAMVGGSAAGSAYGNALRQGYDEDQARAYSSLVGASEALLQYLLGGIGKLGGISGKIAGKVNLIENALLRVAAKYGASITSEIVEEEIQNYLEPAFRSIIFGEDYDAPTVNEWVETAIVTAMSTGVLESGGAIQNGISSVRVQEAQNAKIAKHYGNVSGELVAEALEIDPDNAYAQKMQGRLDSGKKLSGRQLNKLVQQNQQAITTQDRTQFETEVQGRLTELGETGAVETVAAAVVKQVSGEQLSHSEKSALMDSKYGQQVAEEFADFDREQIDDQLMEEPVEAQNLRSGAQEVRENIPAYTENSPQTVAAELEGTTEGQTFQKSTGEIVQVQDHAIFAAIDGNNATALVDGKTEVPADDVSFGNEVDNLIFQGICRIPNITTKGGNTIWQAYRSGQYNGNAKEFGMQAMAVYRAGYLGDATILKAGDSRSNIIKQTHKELIYEEGRKAAAEHYRAQQEQKDAKKKADDDKKTSAKKDNIGRKKGVVRGDIKSLNEVQRKAYKYLRTVAEVTGVDIVLYRSKPNAQGKYTDAQGKYRRSDSGTIYIDLNAGLADVRSADNLAKYAMLRTFAHEFTHFIENWNPIQYNEFRKVVFDTLEARGESKDALIQDKMARNPGMDAEYASREVVAEAMTDILPDANFVQELAEKHKTIFQKLVDQLREFVANLRNYFDSIGNNPSRETNALKEQVGNQVRYLEEIVAQFDKIAVEAVENFQAATTESQTVEQADMVQEQSRGYLEIDSSGYNGLNRDDISDIIKRGTGIKWNNGNALKLPYNEYTAVKSRIATQYHRTENHGGVQFVDRSTDGQNAKHYIYIYVDHGFDNYEIIGRLDYSKQQDLILFLREAIQDGRKTERISARTDRLRDFYEHFDSGWNAYQDRGIDEYDDQNDSGSRGSRRRDNGWTGGSDLSGHNENVNGEQLQQRTDTLTDRDVLAIAKRDGLLENLSKKAQNVASVLIGKIEVLGDLQAKKVEQESILEKLQAENPKNHAEITKTKNRITVYENQIERASTELRKLENMDNSKALMNAVRPAVEQKLIAERKAELAKYGTIPKGEKAVRESNLPQSTDGKNKVSRTARTVYEAGVTPDDFADLIDKEVYLKDGLTYLPITNNATTQEAIRYIQREGWEAARGAWSRQVRNGKVSAELSAMGALLLNNAAKAGDKQTWLDILHDYQHMGTNAAQGLQATRILKKLSPDDSLYMMKRSVSQMVEDMHLQDITIDPELEREYLEATTDTTREQARKKLTKHIAMQIPATLMDRWRALRYVNMLGNLRTQVRNITGNMGMIAVTEMKNLVATGIEQIASLASGGKYNRTTAVFVGKELMKSAKEDFGNVEAIILGGGKYADETAEVTAFSKDVMDQRKIFKFKPLEGYRKLTNWAMEQGDLVFSKHAYATALGRYLKAHGIKTGDLSKVDPALMEEARLHAVKEAQETTFRDTNTLSGWISKIGRRKDTPKAARVLSEGIMPFRKTPANILVRAEEYSPLGIINSIVKSVQAMRKDSQVTGNQVINSWAKSLTGTGIFLLGMLLQQLGLLTGGPDEDEGQDQFESLYGWQNYAITLPNGTNLTIDFLSPAAMSLFMGAQFNKIRQDGEVELKEIEGAITSIADPMVEMSMLQGVNDTLENVQYAEDNLGQFAINAAMSYLTQGLTNTMVGQFERSFERERMTTYVDKDSNLPNWLQRQLGKMSAKTPGWDYNQVPYINAWGEEEEYPSVPANMAQNMLSPSFVDKGKTDAVYTELMRLNSVQSTNVFPKTPEKTVSFTDKNGVEFENYNLTAEEYVALAKAKGQTQRKVIEDMVSNSEYQKLSDEDKVKAIRFAYTYANEKAMIDVLNAEGFRAKWRQQIKGNVAQAIIKHVLEQ